jgi:hypothetical protein
MSTTTATCQSKNDDYFIEYLTNNFRNLHSLEGIYNVTLEVSEPTFLCRSCIYPDLKFNHFDKVVIYKEGAEYKLFSLNKNVGIGSVEINSSSYDGPFTFRLNTYAKNYMSSESWHNPIQGVVTTKSLIHGFTSNKTITTSFISPHALTEYKKLFDIFSYDFAKYMEIKCNSDDPMCYFVDVMYRFFRTFPDESFVPPPIVSSGTGFFINESGVIVTNHHVVFTQKKYLMAQHEEIMVKLLDDPMEYPADVIAYDEKSDLAILKLRSNPKPSYPIKYLHIKSSEFEIGNEAFTLGYPFGELTGSNIKFTKLIKFYERRKEISIN